MLLAREAATLDLLSDGRLELGLGAGHMQSEYEQAGLSFDPGATRVQRLAEAVTIVTRLLEGQEVTSPAGTIMSPLTRSTPVRFSGPPTHLHRRQRTTAALRGRARS